MYEVVNVVKRFLTFCLLVVLIMLGLELIFGSPHAHAATISGTPLGPNPLGVNVSPRQPDNQVVNARIHAQLQVLGPVSIRYGGGTLGDSYFWNVNKDTYDCAEQWTSDPSRSCARNDTLNLSTVEAYAKPIGGTVMPIVNYGSGTPALAASMVTASNGAPSVELGNEPYGCDSIINELTLPPTNDTGFQHGVPADCPYTLYGGVGPGLVKMGQSFLTYAPGFINAIKTASPGMKVEFPYAISPAGNSGYVWNDTVMPALKNYDGLVVLWYPAYSRPLLSDAAALNSVRHVPGLAAAIRGDIAKYHPGIPWQIGETNDSNTNNVLTCRPAGSVFAAVNALAWLYQGASNVNWWDETDPVNAAGSCSKPDFAMFDSTGVPQPPYWGYVLASKLAQPHAVLSSIHTASDYYLEYHAQLRGGHQAVAYVNLSTKAAKMKMYPWANANLPTFRTNGHGVQETHTQQVALVKHGVTVGAESIVVFTR
jgi:hypothetical protein